MKKKKVRLRKWVYIAFIIIIIIVILLITKLIYHPSNENKNSNSSITSNEVVEEKIDYITELLKYNNSDYDKEFLEFIKSKYNDLALEKLYSYVKDNKYNKTIWHEVTGNSYIVLSDLYKNKYTGNNQVTIIDGNKNNVSISFAGDISLADNWEIMPYYKSRGKKIYGVLGKDVVKYMNDTDLMIINNEFCFSNRGTPLANKKYTFRANPKNVSIYKEIGVDMVTLANNHVYDYGKDAFLDTLDTLNKAKMPYIGAGKNSNEAMKAYYFVINGYKISFLNASRAEKYILTPEATKNNPGVFRAYDPKPLANRIKEEKKKSDYVVALLHWGREDSHELEDVIKKDGKLYVDSGADLVVGSHAHVLEGMEYYKGKLIAYNLGDFLFSHVTDYTGILTLNLNNNGSMTYKFIPAYENNFKTTFLSGNDASKLYNMMTKWSINVKIDNKGNVIKR